MDSDKQDILAVQQENITVMGIQKLIAELNRRIGFRIQLTSNIQYMLLLDAIERVPSKNDAEKRKIKGICEYLRLVESLKTFNMIQKTFHGSDLMMLLGETGGEKIDFTKILKELLGDTEKKKE